MAGRWATSSSNAWRRSGGFVGREDLTDYRVVERKPIRGQYRGWEIVGPPPPAASGVHITQMLNILEGYDIAGLGFGTVDGIHLLAEVLKIAFADRAQASGDPDFVKVPVERITSKAYARRAPRRHRSRPRPALDRRPAGDGRRGHHASHRRRRHGQRRHAPPRPSTACSARCFIVPGTGMVPNNYMSNFDPRPGNALSIAPGKRVTTSMSPMMARARRPGRLCAGPARRPQDLPRRLAGAGQPDRPRHGAAGGGRGAAGLDRRARARGRARHSGRAFARAWKPAVTRCR